MDELNVEQMEIQVADHIIESVTRTAISRGLIDLKGLTKEEARIKAIEYVNEEFKNKSNFSQCVIDHKDTLLNEARDCVKNGKNELAIILYGTWWEHWLNGVIECRTFSHGLNEKDFKEIVRSLNNRSKSSWLFKLLKLPALEEAHLKTINLLIEQRNQFVHYKYPGKDWEGDSPLFNECFDQFELAIEYFKNYENDNLYESFELYRKK